MCHRTQLGLLMRRYGYCHSHRYSSTRYCWALRVERTLSGGLVVILHTCTWVKITGKFCSVIRGCHDTCRRLVALPFSRVARIAGITQVGDHADPVRGEGTASRQCSVVYGGGTPWCVYLCQRERVNFSRAINEPLYITLFN